MDSIYKLANYINENWAMICTIILIAAAAYRKIKNFFSLSKEEQDEIVKEQVEIAKSQIKEILLHWVTEAECDYLEWLKAGEIKRSLVIDRVFKTYPILSQVTNQAEVIQWIDEAIDEALEKMREIFEENKTALKKGKYQT